MACCALFLPTLTTGFGPFVTQYTEKLSSSRRRQVRSLAAARAGARVVRYGGQYQSGEGSSSGGEKHHHARTHAYQSDAHNQVRGATYSSPQNSTRPPSRALPDHQG